MNTFDELDLSAEILRAIGEMGFEKPSEIQKEAIPKLLTGDHDFIGLAQTGTGKTAAFGLPLLELIDPKEKHTQALVLAPTRELGRQIAEQIKLFSKYIKGLSVLAVYGGENISTQIRALKKPQHIVIATPGRLIDLSKRKAIKLNKIDFLVLDEADEMLNMGFKEEIDKILEYTPDEKSTWLFSATMPKGIRHIVNNYMDNPVEVKLNAKNETNKNISHQYALVKGAQKREALMRFIDIDAEMRGVVFCRTKLGTQNLAEALMQEGYRADALHGDMSQSQRDRVMRRFKDKSLQLLVATDVAARGIDVNDLTHVFHFMLPDDLAYYTHRSGRTARAGKKGISIAFINNREKSKIDRFAKQLNIEFERAMIPNTADIAEIRVESWCQKILEKKAKKKLNPELLEKANLIFGNLSKEELVSKILLAELQKLNLTGGSDLNASAASDRSRGDGRDRRRGGGGGRDRDRKRGGDRERDRDRKKRKPRGKKPFKSSGSPDRRAKRKSDRRKRS